MFLPRSIIPVQLDMTNTRMVYYPPVSPYWQSDVSGSLYQEYSPKINCEQLPLENICQANVIPKELTNMSETNSVTFHDQTKQNMELIKEQAWMKSGNVENKRSKKERHYKRKPCWHFLRGYCERGNSCRFQHSFTDATHHSQKVFLPGLPSDITEVALQEKLSDMGCNLINKLVSLHKSWPRVCLGSPEEAQVLFKKGKFSINGHPVEVRPWNAVAEKKRERVADITRRSIFLGGLPIGVTCKMIRKEFENFGAKVVNLMQVKRGFCPKVTLATVEQALRLVSAGEVEINGSMVDVRPYQPRNSCNDTMNATTATKTWKCRQ